MNSARRSPRSPRPGYASHPDVSDRIEPRAATRCARPAAAATLESHRGRTPSSARLASAVRRRLVCCLAPFLLTAASFTSFASEDPLGEASQPGLHLDLMPVPFQKNPVLAMTVITEFTDHGRTLPAASPDHPLYYVLHDAGFKPRGDALAGERPPSPEQLATAMKTALAKDGFLPADETHLPDLALIYYWGSYSTPDREMAALFPEAAWRSMIERAALVGGDTFRRELEVYGSPNESGLNRLFNWVGREKTQYFLFDQASHDLHYVVVSAYQYDELAHNSRRLAWRTTMTVNGVGTSMSETLRPLVLTAGSYFGREVPAIALKRRVRRGTVELGPLKVVDEEAVATFTTPPRETTPTPLQPPATLPR